MNDITIPTVVFEDLAAGYGDEEAIRLLWEGQRSRRLLLLGAIANGCEESAPWISLLAEIAERDSGAFETILAYPLLEQWLFRCLSDKADVRYIGCVSAAAAAAARQPFQLTLKVEAGAILFPTVGELTGLEGERAELLSDGNSIVVRCGDTHLELIWPYTTATERWRPFQTLELTAIQLAVEDTDPLRDCFGSPIADRLSQRQLKEFHQRLGAACDILMSEHPRHFSSMRKSLRLVVPLEDPADGRTVSSSARGAFGAVAVSLSMSDEALALQLLHEYMHMKLWAVMDLVVLNHDGGTATHLAPWRRDPRTVPALLQGTYAHLGVSEFWRVRRHTATGKHRREAELQYGYWLEQTRFAVGTLLDSGELTEDGLFFVRVLGRTLSEWAAEPIEAWEASHDLVTASAVEWRLRNTSPESDYVVQLAQMRAAGLPGPTRLEKPRVTPARAEGWRLSALEQLIRAWYTNPDTASCEDAAHRAFLDRDYESARSLYLQVLRREPTRHDVWSGLAIALARTGDERAGKAFVARPDLVRALMLSTGEDPVAVGRWLG